MTHWIKIMFPSLTDGNTLYNIGDVEKNPSSFLIDCAKNKTRLFHRDSRKMYRICKFVKKGSKEEDEEYVPEEFRAKAVEPEVERTPVVAVANEDQEMIDELKFLSRKEKETIAQNLGIKKSVVSKMKDKQLIGVIVSLRKV